eukprot:scaffold107947_cov35-Attheya_sp.AAC.1
MARPKTSHRPDEDVDEEESSNSSLKQLRRASSSSSSSLASTPKSRGHTEVPVTPTPGALMGVMGVRKYYIDKRRLE